MSFPNTNSKGKEKYIPSASDWSPWEWDNGRGYFTSYRTNSTGATEWAYKDPEPSTPRSPNYPSQDLSKHRANYGPDQGENYLHSQKVQTSQELSPSSHTNSVSVAAPYKITPQNNSPYSRWNSQASAGYPGPSNHSSVTGPSYNSANPGALSSINNDFQKLNLNPGTSYSGGFPGGATQGPPGAADAYANLREITSRGQREIPDTLDHRYRVVPDNQARKFWRSGRVFKMLWSEPAGEKSGKAKTGTANNSHISYALHGGKVYTEIRRFVVVQDGYGYCICLAIHTYSGRATLKPNLPDKARHAIIYTSTEPPPFHSESYPDGTVATEELSIDPIKVNGTTREDGEGTLDPKSRLSFVKLYTVEKDVRICNIGIVNERSMRILEYYSPIKMTIPPISLPAPAPVTRQRQSREDSDGDEETAMEAEPRARMTGDVPQSSSRRESSKKYEQPGPSSSRRESHSGQQRQSRPRRHSVVQPASSSRKDKSPSREPGSSSKPAPKR